MSDIANHNAGLQSRPRLLNAVTICSSLVIGVTAIWLGIDSLHWRIRDDFPMVFYFAWLIERAGYVPYRDIFDPNMPGTYLLMALIGKLSNYQDFGVRCFDMAWLCAIWGLTIGWVRRIGWRQAALGPALFAMFYLAAGPMDSLEREYCMLMPVTAALFVVFGLRPGADVAKAATAGILFGLGFTLKPHILLFMPWIMVFHILDIRERTKESAWVTRRTISVAGAWLAGAALVICATFIYLWCIGALGAFWEMASHYWGLYGRLTGGMESITREERIKYILTNIFTAYPVPFWLPISLLGFGSSLLFGELNPAQRRLIFMTAGLSIIAIVYVILAGKFFEYHWMFHSFFLCQLAALNFTPMARAPSRLLRALPPGALVFTLIFVGEPFLLFSPRLSQLKRLPPKNGRVDKIANFLKANVRPGDKIQPMDWTDGATHAMLEAGATAATRFNGDYMFCHDVSNPYIQGLRREFTETMEKVRPRFVIYVETNRPQGLDCDNQTTALIPRLTTDYRVALKGDHFKVYEKIADGTTTRPQTGN